jgi:acyl carrier protein
MGDAMNRAEIMQDVLKILSRYQKRAGTSAPLTESTLLFKDLDIDSARLVDIVLDLEEKFGVTIDDSNLDEIKTVGDIVQLVDSLKK